MDRYEVTLYEVTLSCGHNVTYNLGKIFYKRQGCNICSKFQGLNFLEGDHE
jgi:hypothetical protein